MNEVSISQISPPLTRLHARKHGLARKALLRLLDSLQVGSLIVRDGDELLRFGDPETPGGPHADITVHDPRAYAESLIGGNIGAGEAYMRGYWSAVDLTEVTRLFTANMRVLDEMDDKKPWWQRLGLGIAHALNRNNETGSRRNISAHYDLGNEFFCLFLDPTMMYSSAVFPDAGASLETAAVYKLDAICQDLELKPDDHLLEIGTGWGGMAVHAASRYGCRVTTTTISREQYRYALERVAAAGLADRVTVLCEDYRKLTGKYDKLVSIEMIEAVGHEYYSSYFERCGTLLKDSGLMLIQAITIADQRYEQARRAVDFIKRYIFPGGCLPSVTVMAEHLTRSSDLQIVKLRDITPDYARTLAAWRERFWDNEQAVRAQGFDDMFMRMWDYYLSYCEGGFRERVISTVQLCAAKPGYRFAS